MPNFVRNGAIFLASMLLSLALAEVAVRLLVTVRDVGPVFSVPDPWFGKRLKPNLSAVRTTPEFTMRLTTNSFGFRGPQTDRLPLHAILFLGDSFTMGYGVSDGEEYPALIAAALQQRYAKSAPPVINAGIGNSGNGFWLKILARYGEAIQPRVVVMQVFEND